jgi:Outer membrane protein beta-barrel domain
MFLKIYFKGYELMNIKTFLTGKTFGKSGFILVALLFGSISAFGQAWEISPVVGGTFGGTIKVGEPDMPNFNAHIAESLSFGATAGYRFKQEDGVGVIEFRWLRQNTNLGVAQNPLVVTPYTPALFRVPITMDRYLADFTHEFTTDDEFKSIQPFISIGLGAATMGAPASSGTRFAFSLGTGVKIFPTTHWGFRLNVDYMPIVMHAELQRLFCTGGACSFALSGGVVNQFEVSVGPAFRF